MSVLIIIFRAAVISKHVPTSAQSDEHSRFKSLGVVACVAHDFGEIWIVKA